MKNKWVIVLFTFLIGCAGSPTRTAVDAERNRMDMMDLRKNMSMEDVRDLMGIPTKVERRSMNGIEYEIWYYITQGVTLAQTRYIDENFTPFVFYGTCLRGWGWQFYNHLFDINNARYKSEENTRTKYTQKDEDWPNNEHKIINPSKQARASDEEKSIEETLKKFIQSGDNKSKSTQPQGTGTIPSSASTPTSGESPSSSTILSPPASTTPTGTPPPDSSSPKITIPSSSTSPATQPSSTTTPTDLNKGVLQPVESIPQDQPNNIKPLPQVPASGTGDGQPKINSWW